MLSIPAEVILEISGWLCSEERALLRLVSRVFTCVRRPSKSANLLEYGAKHGNLEICKLGENQYMEYCWGLAAAGGHLDILKWADEVNNARCSRGGGPASTWWYQEACEKATYNGHVHVLEWMLSLGRLDTSKEIFCAIAAHSGSLETLKWLRASGCAWGLSVGINAAHSGSVEILEWTRENGGKIPGGVAEEQAAKQGHLEVLKWFWDRGYPWNPQICCSAALSGHTHILEWARGLVSPKVAWDPKVCWCAAYGGHFETLKWLRNAGCPWDKNIYAVFIGHDRPDMLRYALEHGCPHEFEKDGLSYYSPEIRGIILEYV